MIPGAWSLPAQLLHRGGWLSSPDASLLMLAAGGLLIAVECLRPARVLPGALGLLLVLVSVHQLCAAPLHPSGMLLLAVGCVLLALTPYEPLRVAAGVAATCLLAAATALLPADSPSVGHLLLRLLPGAVLGGALALLLPAAALARRNKRSSSAAANAPLPWRSHAPE